MYLLRVGQRWWCFLPRTWRMDRLWKEQQQKWSASYFKSNYGTSPSNTCCTCDWSYGGISCRHWWSGDNWRHNEVHFTSIKRDCHRNFKCDLWAVSSTHPRPEWSRALQWHRAQSPPLSAPGPSHCSWWRASGSSGSSCGPPARPLCAGDATHWQLSPSGQTPCSWCCSWWGGRSSAQAGEPGETQANQLSLSQSDLLSELGGSSKLIGRWLVFQRFQCSSVLWLVATLCRKKRNSFFYFF